MAQWRIQQISRLTNISIRMLRHYDKIGLLKPSMRSSNGYRWYSEEDLARLQQIVALRFFGFNLKQIAAMLQEKKSFKEHLLAQQQLLIGQTEQLTQAQAAIASILKRMESLNSIKWNDLITLIERYHMTQNAKKTWAKALNEEQMAEFISIKQTHPSEMSLFESLIEKINTNQIGAPDSASAQDAVKTLIDLSKKIHATSGEKQRHLGASIMKSAREGKIKELALTQDGQVWQSKATTIYWINRWNDIYNNILNNLDKDPTGAIGNKVAIMWQELINDHFVGAPSALSIGTLLWQVMLRAKDDIDKTKELPSLNQIANLTTVPPILSNPEALQWIDRALSAFEINTMTI